MKQKLTLTGVCLAATLIGTNIANAAEFQEYTNRYSNGKVEQVCRDSTVISDPRGVLGHFNNIVTLSIVGSEKLLRVDRSIARDGLPMLYRGQSGNSVYSSWQSSDFDKKHEITTTGQVRETQFWQNKLRKEGCSLD